MKSRAKVISQKHIKEIPPFCDNPMSAEDVELQHRIESGQVNMSISLNRRQRKAILRGPKRSGKVKH